MDPTRLALAFAFAIFPALLPAADWPQFLGPNRNGKSAETGLIDKWPADGPKEIWRQPLGAGMSGMAIRGARVVTMMQDETQQFVVSLDAKTGRQTWQTPVSKAYRNQMGDGPRATPTISGETVYVYTGEGILAAVSEKSGKLLWSANAVKDAGGKPAEYGNASSPLVVNNVVVVQTGGPDGAVSAFDRKNGKPVWKSGSGAAGYSSPIAATFGGTDQVIAFAGSGAFGINPDDGAVLWSHAYPTDFDCNTASPVVLSSDELLISSGENHGSTVLTGKASGGDVAIDVAWSSLGRDSVLRAEWQTPILIDGYLYALDNVGSAGPVTNLTCVKASTGERVWQERRFGKSNLIAADSKLFLSTMKGELVIVRATPDRYDEIGRATVIGSTRQAPALSDGRLYLRDNDEIVCLDVRGRR